MRWALTVILLLRGLSCWGSASRYQPTETEIAQHRATIFESASEYVVETFNLEVIEESKFNPVRFSSTGIWGDFEARVKELGADSFEAQGWVIAEGNNGMEPIVWYVIVTYPLVDPEGWRYRRIDEPFVNEPQFNGWKLRLDRKTQYQSVPYNASYHESFEDCRPVAEGGLSH